MSALAAYQQTVQDFHTAPRLAFKFYAPVFSAPLATLPPAVDFTKLADAALAKKVSYEPTLRLLQFSGILSGDGQAALAALSSNPARSGACVLSCGAGEHRRTARRGGSARSAHLAAGG